MLVAFVFVYIMLNIILVHKGQKILLRSRLVKLGESLEFYLPLIGFFFLDGEDQQIKFR